MRKLIISLLTLIFVLGLSVSATFAEPEDKTMTLEQAIGLSLKNSSSLIKAQGNIDIAKAQRDDASAAVSFIPVEGSEYDADFESNWNKLLTADLNWRKSEKTLGTTRDSVVMSVYKSFWDVQTAQMKLDLQQKLNRQSLTKLQDTRTGVRAGTVSPPDLATAEAAWQQAQSSLVTARNALDTAYTNFNQLLGLHPDERLQLTDTPVFEPLNITSLDYEVEKAVENSPDVWEALQNITKAEWAADMMFFNGSYTTYTERQIAVDQAELSAADAKESLDKSIRNLYYQIKNQEESYAVDLVSLKTAQDNLRIAKLKYDAGMITNAEVIAAEIEVAKAQETIEEMVRNHAYSVMTFQKPWAA
ncbi:MAG: TolC family protein [Bacillota bacterium]